MCERVCMYCVFVCVSWFLCVLCLCVCVCVYIYIYIYIYIYMYVCMYLYILSERFLFKKFFILEKKKRHAQLLSRSDFFWHPRGAAGGLKITAIPIIIEGRFQVFQRFSRSKLVLKAVESCFVAHNYYGNGITAHVHHESTGNCMHSHAHTAVTVNLVQSWTSWDDSI